MEQDICERSLREAREHFADVVNDAIQGRVTYLTSRGRRVAALVPLAKVAREGQPSEPASARSTA